MNKFILLLLLITSSNLFSQNTSYPFTLTMELGGSTNTGFIYQSDFGWDPIVFSFALSGSNSAYNSYDGIISTSQYPEEITGTDTYLMGGWITAGYVYRNQNGFKHLFMIGGEKHKEYTYQTRYDNSGILGAYTVTSNIDKLPVKVQVQYTLVFPFGLTLGAGYGGLSGLHFRVGFDYDAMQKWF